MRRMQVKWKKNEKKFNKMFAFDNNQNENDIPARRKNKKIENKLND